MFIIAAIALCAISARLAGGRLSNLNDLRLRATVLLISALAIQIVSISVIPDRLHGVHAPAHIVSYVL